MSRQSSGNGRSPTASIDAAGTKARRKSTLRTSLESVLDALGLGRRTVAPAVGSGYSRNSTNSSARYMIATRKSVLPAVPPDIGVGTKLAQFGRSKSGSGAGLHIQTQRQITQAQHQHQNQHQQQQYYYGSYSSCDGGTSSSMTARFVAPPAMTRGSSLQVSVTQRTSGTSRMSGRSMQSVVHSPGSPETQRRQVEQRVLWEKYCEWLELIRDFAELESNQSHTSTADLAGCISFADYSRLDSPSESLIAESVGTAVHNAQCEKHVSEFPRIVLSQRPVSFGNQSVASFNSNDSPIVLSDNLLSGSGYANSCSSTAVIADSELFPLPPEAAGLVRCMPTESVMELLRMSPSNDYINAVLAYNCATPATLWRRPASSTCSSEATYMQSTTYNVLPRSTSALSTQTPEQFARYSAPPILSSAVVPTLPMHIRAAWESDLRMRLLPTDWTKLVEELLQNNCGSVFASAALQEHNRHISTTERTHYESKVYWDIVWRTLPLGCQRGDETCARCGNLVETFVHFLWTCPVAARLWRRLERVIGALAASVLEAQRIDIPARQSFESARSAGGSSVRDYGVRADGRIRITLVDVLFCFPRIRSGGGGRGFQRNNSAQLSEKFCKTLNLLHATALVSLFEARAYHSEGEDIGWSLFVTRYQARRDVHIERRDIV